MTNFRKNSNASNKILGILKKILPKYLGCHRNAPHLHHTTFHRPSLPPLRLCLSPVHLPFYAVPLIWEKLNNSSFSGIFDAVQSLKISDYLGAIQFLSLQIQWSLLERNIFFSASWSLCNLLHYSKLFFSWGQPIHSGILPPYISKTCLSHEICWYHERLYLQKVSGYWVSINNVENSVLVVDAVVNVNVTQSLPMSLQSVGGDRQLTHYWLGDSCRS